MKMGKIVLGISLLICAMLYFATPQEESIYHRPAKVEVRATLELMEPYVKENEQFRQLTISYEGFDIAETKEETVFIDEEELDRRLTNNGADDPFAQRMNPPLLYQRDNYRSEYYSRMIYLAKISEDEVAKRLGDYAFSYKLKGLNGAAINGQVVIGDILQIQYPLDLEVYGEVSAVDDSAFQYAKEIFDVEGLTQEDVLQLDIGLLCEEVDVDDMVTIDLGPLDEKLPNQTRLQYYINDERVREKREDEIYHTEALLYIGDWERDEIESFLNQYQLSYDIRRWEPDFAWASKVKLEGIWRYRNSSGGVGDGNEL